VQHEPVIKAALLALPDGLFTRDRPIIFACHGYPWLIHRLTYGGSGK
jgi:phosphoketolase